jgi:hypothetical protein
MMKGTFVVVNGVGISGFGVNAEIEVCIPIRLVKNECINSYQKIMI